jgi:PAS domain S-box-containing protein
MAARSGSRGGKRGRVGIAGLRQFTWLFALALVAFGLAELGIFAFQRNQSSWADHSRQVARLARTAYATVLERETAVQAALLAPGGFRVPRPDVSAAALDSTLDSLVVLTGDNPDQQNRARAIVAAVQRWRVGFVVPALGGRLVPTAAPEVADRLFAEVRMMFAQFLTAEDVLYADRRDRTGAVGWLAMAALLVPSGLMAGLVVASGRRYAGQAEQLDTQQEQLEEQAVELEQQVQELEVSNTELLEAVEAEREAREQFVAESRERQRKASQLDAALMNSPVAVSLVDADLNYLRVNHATAAITGVPAEDHVGVPMRQINPALDPGLEAAMRQVLRSGEPIRNFEMMRGAGQGARSRYLLLNLHPVKGPDGDALGLAIAAVDMTDQRELLEQFHHAQKLEAVGRLAAGIAHDFNNLLTVIRSYCDLALLEMPNGAPGREEIGEVRQAGERAAALARQMVAMSRKQAIIPRALPAGEVVAELEPMLRRVTADTLTLRLDLERPLGIVHIDPTQLEQVLMNLVINAVDATAPGGEIVIEGRNVMLDADDVRRMPGLQPGPHVALSVSDTGAGIDPETMQKIFEPFFTTKPAGKGTGLGLSTVYGIVRDAGGYVRVESTVGRGTTFCVFLSAELSDEGKTLRDTPRVNAMQAAAMAHETVLVVEDDDLLRASLRRALKRRGYDVLEASHGGEALRVAGEHSGPIHLALSDFHMPGMDGRDLVVRLKEARPTLRVLFMSGSSASPDDARGQAADGHPFLPKPFSLDDLAARVREVLDA